MLWRWRIALGYKRLVYSGIAETGSKREGGTCLIDRWIKKVASSPSANLSRATAEVLTLTSAMVTRIWVRLNYGILLIKCNSLSRLGVL